MESQRVYRKDETMNHQLTSAKPTLQTKVKVCEQSHAWQPTIIIGYFRRVRCDTLAACSICISKMRGKPLVGMCQQHQHLGTPKTEQEVLA